MLTSTATLRSREEPYRLLVELARGKLNQVRNQLTEWVDVQKQVRKQLGPGGTSQLDTQTLERLRSLGYVGGAKK